MAITNATIATLPTHAAAYTSLGNNAITSIIICNTQPYNPSNPTDHLDYLFLHAVPSGGSTSPPAENATIVNGLPIPAGETVSLDQEKLVFESGDKLVASCTSGYLVMTISTLAV